MIDLGASNIVMCFKIMEALGLKVDTKQGRCCALDYREVPIIGSISALPYKLVAYPDSDLNMSVLVVDIPPRFGMLLSRKWRTTMWGSLQYDLSFFIFHVDNKDIKVNREPKVIHKIEERVDDNATCFLDMDINACNATCFLDMDINAFREEPIVLPTAKTPTPIS